MLRGSVIPNCDVVLAPSETALIVEVFRYEGKQEFEENLGFVWR